MGLKLVPPFPMGSVERAIFERFMHRPELLAAIDPGVLFQLIDEAAVVARDLGVEAAKPEIEAAIAHQVTTEVDELREGLKADVLADVAEAIDRLREVQERVQS